MIPEKKKTPEEIAALRGDLGVPSPAAKEAVNPIPAHIPQTGEQVIHLDIPAIPRITRTPPPHSLRKQDLPLAPAPRVTRKTPLPTRRHEQGDIAQIRKREALAQLETPGQDPAARLRAQTASPFLYVPGYLLAVAAAVTAYQRVHPVTPLTLLGLSLLITFYIAVRKPRSRHHAALIFLVIFLTAALGGTHYAPFYQHGP